MSIPTLGEEMTTIFNNVHKAPRHLLNPSIISLFSTFLTKKIVCTVGISILST